MTRVKSLERVLLTEKVAENKKTPCIYFHTTSDFIPFFLLNRVPKY